MPAPALAVKQFAPVNARFGAIPVRSHSLERLSDRRGLTWPWVVGPALVITAIIVAGSSLGSPGVAVVGAGLALVAAILVPEIGLAILAAVAPMVSPPGIPPPGLSTMLVMALLLGCIYRLPIERPRLRLNVSGLLLVGFAAYATAQQVPEMLNGYVGELDRAIGYLLIQLLTGLGIVLVGAWILRDRSPIPVLSMALAGAAFATGLAVATFESPVSGPPFAGLVATGEVGLRAAGPFHNPNYMGTFAAAVIVGSLGLWRAVRSPRARTLLIGVTMLFLVALVQAQSRGAFVALFAGVAALIWLQSRRLAIAVVGVGLVVAVLVYPAFVEWRLTNLRGDVSDAGYVAMFDSDNARIGAALAGPAMFLSAPIFGVGFGQFVTKSVEVSGLETGINAHNWYINVLAEQGLTGGLLWVGATVALARELRVRRGAARLVGVGVFSTLVVGFLFLEGPTSFQLVALPSLFLVAAIVSDWAPRQVEGNGLGGVIGSRGS